MKGKLIITMLVGMGLILSSFPGTAASPTQSTGARSSEASSQMIWTRLGSGPKLSDADSWANLAYYPTIQTADIDGDGREELLARDMDGMRAWHYDDATGWTELQRGPAWSDATGWANAPYNTTIQTADINGDGRAELLGRDMLGMQVWRYVDETTGWTQLHRGPDWSDALGWSNMLYNSTIQTGDINGDGQAELLARDMLGIQAWRYVDETTGWVELKRGPDWSDGYGWENPQCFATIQTGDIDGDGRAELLARYVHGILAWRYIDETTGWEQLAHGPYWFDTASVRTDETVYTWANPNQYVTIQTGDINGDGDVELLGMNTSLLEAWDYDGDTNLWVPLPETPWSVWDGWGSWQYFFTIQTADFNGDQRAELLGRMSEGMEIWGWDYEGSVSEALELVYVDEFNVELVGSNVAIYSPIVPNGYFALGDYSQPVHDGSSGFTFAARELAPGALAAPIGYEYIWAPGYSVWRPLPPAGYVLPGLSCTTKLYGPQPEPDPLRTERPDSTRQIRELYRI
jgi:hypothetical protein